MKRLYEMNEVLYAALHATLWLVLFGAVTTSVAAPLGGLLAGGGLL